MIGGTARTRARAHAGNPSHHIPHGLVCNKEVYSFAPLQQRRRERRRRWNSRGGGRGRDDTGGETALEWANVLLMCCQYVAHVLLM